MTQTPITVAEANSTEPTRRRSFLLLYVLLGVALLAAGTYAFAWYRAYSLSLRFMDNAAESFQAGEYLNALTGYEEFDEAQNRYIYRGGYGQVVRIWEDPYALPRPAEVAEARQFTDEIIGERLTLDDAETFIEANVGQRNPYLGRVYLRTGELYEKEGDADDAADVYEEVAELFPNAAVLIETAKAHLERLEAAE